MSLSVLFVCMGNICRSPAAEGVLRHLAGQAGLEIEIDSAGTIGYHAGDPADARMRSAATQRGYELTSRARQVTSRDLSRFGLVIAMDRANYGDLLRLAEPPGSNIRMLSDFLPEGEDWPRDVPDPYYGKDDGFGFVLDMLEAACPAILRHVTATTDSLD